MSIENWTRLLPHGSETQELTVRELRNLTAEEIGNYSSEIQVLQLQMYMIHSSETHYLEVRK